MVKKNPALQGIQNSVKDLSGVFDQNGMGENMATLDRARQEEDAYYRDAIKDPGVAGAEAMRQQGGSIMQDPGMKVFLQKMHEGGMTIGRKSGLDLPNSPTGIPSTFDPMSQTSAVDSTASDRATRAMIDRARHPEYYANDPSYAGLKQALKTRK